MKYRLITMVILFSATCLIAGLISTGTVKAETPVIIAADNLPSANPKGVEDACKYAPDNPYCQTKPPLSSENSIADIISRITIFIAMIGGLLAVLLIIFGGFRFIISNGDPERAKKARYIILYSVIGLVIIVVAQAIIVFVLSQI